MAASGAVENKPEEKREERDKKRKNPKQEGRRETGVTRDTAQSIGVAVADLALHLFVRVLRVLREVLGGGAVAV
jgi:hypothetical protein